MAKFQAFRAGVLAELQTYKDKKKTCPSWHQAYGLIAEELDEFWDEVKRKDNKREKANALKELIQIAALCEHAAEQLGLLEEE